MTFDHTCLTYLQKVSSCCCRVFRELLKMKIKTELEDVISSNLVWAQIRYSPYWPAKVRIKNTKKSKINN